MVKGCTLLDGLSLPFFNLCLLGIWGPCSLDGRVSPSLCRVNHLHSLEVQCFLKGFHSSCDRSLTVPSLATLMSFVVFPLVLFRLTFSSFLQITVRLGLLMVNTHSKA